MKQEAVCTLGLPALIQVLRGTVELLSWVCWTSWLPLKEDQGLMERTEVSLLRSPQSSAFLLGVGGGQLKVP